MRLSDLGYLEALILNGTAFKFRPDGCPISEDEEEYAGHPGKVYRVVGDAKFTEGHANRDDISSVGEESLGGKVAPAEHSQIQTSDETSKPSFSNLADLEENETTDTEPSCLSHRSDAAAGEDEEAFEGAGDLFAKEKTYDSDELDEASDTASSAVVSADDEFAEPDAAGKKTPSSPPSTCILLADAPQIAALQMARRPSENDGSQDDAATHIDPADSAKNRGAGSNNFSGDQAERTRAADMDDEDF